MAKKQKHKKPQEKNTLLEFLLAYGWAIIIVLVVVSVLLYFGKIGTANWRLQKFCEYESDNCVFTPNDKFLAMYPSAKYSDSALNTIQQYCNEHKRRDICDFRKKTQTEIDIDDCNSNPREDEECKCEKEYYECRFNYHSNGYSFFGNNHLEGFCSEDIPTKTCCERFWNGTYVKTSLPDFSGRTCLKSRPKTDWEKYPENYIQEIKTVINEEWVHNCCEEVNISLKNINMLYTANFICFEANGSAFSQINTVNISKCQSTPKLINQTTYRLKNQCEKGEKPWTVIMDILCNSTKFSPITGFNVTEEDLKLFQDYGYNCSISNEYKNCD